MASLGAAALILCTLLALSYHCRHDVDALGVNWGTIAYHPLPPKIVVQTLRDNGIGKVKLFDAASSSMTALAGSGIEVMVAIPNNMLGTMNDYGAARTWVAENVTKYNFDGGVTIRYVAIGNEPFLPSYNNIYINITLPALQNIQKALDEAGVGDTIKATIPLNANVYNSPTSTPVPSAGRFDQDVAPVDLMTSIVEFLSQSGAPFTVNIYPFLSLYDDDNFPLDYAFFDGTSSPVIDNGIQYENVFDANFDTLVSALKAVGFGELPIIVGEVGWPTDGDRRANIANAQRFYNGLLKHLASSNGTPLRPNQQIEAYLFSLVDEDAKSIEPGNFERHWGILRFDGQPKFPLDLSGQGRSNIELVPASGVQYLPRIWCVLNQSTAAVANTTTLGNSIRYACEQSDCTSLGYGCSCNGLDINGNASYAFNMYFQDQSHADMSCGFQGLAVQTTQDPSTAACNFPIQIVTESGSSKTRRRAPALTLPLMLVFAAIWLW